MYGVINHIRTGAYLAVTWAALLAVVILIKPPGEKAAAAHQKLCTDMMLYGLAPMALLGFGASYLRLTTWSKFVLKRFRCTRGSAGAATGGCRGGRAARGGAREGMQQVRGLKLEGGADAGDAAGFVGATCTACVACTSRWTWIWCMSMNGGDLAGCCRHCSPPCCRRLPRPLLPPPLPLPLAPLQRGPPRQQGQGHLPLQQPCGGGDHQQGVQVRPRRGAGRQGGCAGGAGRSAAPQPWDRASQPASVQKFMRPAAARTGWLAGWLRQQF